MSQENTILTMPVLAVRGMVLFPNMILHFDVGRERSINALNEAMEDDRMLFLTAQKDMRDDDPEWDEIYEVGVVAEIKQIIKAKGYLRVLVEGKYRAKLITPLGRDPYLTARIEEYPNASVRGISAKTIEALQRTIKNSFEQYVGRSPRLTREILFGAISVTDPLQLTDYVTSNLPISFQVKQEILEETSVLYRLRKLAKILEEENDILSLEQEIHENIREQIETNQREYYLREQMKAIAQELGEGPAGAQQEIEEYRERILALNLEADTEEKLLRELDRLAQMPPNSHETSVIKTWLDTVLDLPWRTETEERLDVSKAREHLEKDHYGMEKVKERILEMLAVRSLAPDQKGQVICLVGPPGVGKTSIARSVAESMNRNYVRMSLGGVRDESDIRGHRKTYVGAMPGRIITSLIQAKSRNPLMLLDEVDKLGSDFRGDPSSALLEVLDTAQNHTFRDHYIEVSFDLSDVLFIATANNLATIPPPLVDRMEIIHLGSYTREEKYQIADRHLVKKQRDKHGLTAEQFSFTEAGLYSLIDHYTKEAGVRELERQIATLCRKTAKLVVEDKAASCQMTPNKIVELLGAHRFKKDDLEKTDEIGLVNGLAWTPVGGEILQIEVAVLEGKGKIVLTGSLGDVMKESAQAAMSYVRSVAEQYGIDKDFYKTKDVHIHVPEGAVPKDGPSAGITITTALVSALAGIPAKGTLAMTGEVSLRGRVLAIGGLREKAMAAYRSGIKQIIIPEANLPNLEDVDDIVKENIKFIPVTHVQEVLDIALLRDKRKAKTSISKPPIGITIPTVPAPTENIKDERLQQ